MLLISLYLFTLSGKTSKSVIYGHDEFYTELTNDRKDVIFFCKGRFGFSKKGTKAESALVPLQLIYEKKQKQFKGSN